MATRKPVEVEVRSFARLFEGVAHVRIPDYQRPYTWQPAQAAALLADVQAVFAGPATDYYLGSVVFYHNPAEDTFEIVDGQQRITTLLVLTYLLDETLPPGLNLTLATHHSVAGIRAVRDFLAGHLPALRHMARHRLFERLTFTRVVTATEDAAFTFFDTQNSRGVPLGVADYLKAYHLRAVAAESLQDIYARDWEQFDVASVDGAGLTALFGQVLWRGRRWKGPGGHPFETDQQIQCVFQQEALRVPAAGSRAEPGGSLLRWALPDECPATGAAGSYSLNAFSLRQPLYQGSHFFEYTRKYAQLHALLFSHKHDAPALRPLRAFWHQVYGDDMSVYLRQFMQLGLVLYYDCFGHRQLLAAAHCLDYWLGAIRLAKHYVRREAALVSFQENAHNLLDLIVQAYRPEEIFELVYRLPRLRDIYARPVTSAGRVQGNYLARVLHYFNRSAQDLPSRHEWTR